MLLAWTDWLASRFSSTLSWWQWAVLAAVPPAIILLYFLKLKRRPLEVPSTFLWHKSIEDLHVNSIWQRLRRNLLLLLQLMLLFLLAVALLRPNLQGRRLTGNRFVFLIDNSASMQATDVKPSRLESAKRRASALIDEMRSGDVAMVVSFADSARIEQGFTDDRRRLREAVEGIQPTRQPTDLLEALRVASGLANPGRSAADVTDEQVAEALPADLYIFSDGKFAPVGGFSLGNLRPTFVPIGKFDAANVGIVAFSVGRSEAQPDQLEAFVRIENFGLQPAQIAVDLYRDGRPADHDEVSVAPGGSQGVTFSSLGSIESGVLRVWIGSSDDALAVDDEAWVVVSPPRRARVLLVTSGNEPLELALKTDAAQDLAEVETIAPGELKTKEHQKLAAGGAYDLIVYDRCRPEQMPRCNTLSIGSVPSEGGWSAKAKVDAPQIIDTAGDHPLLQWIDLGDVVISEGTPLVVPPGGKVLIESQAGPMFAIAPRDEFEDAVLGFTIVDEQAVEAGKSARYYRTNWHIRPSFPSFVLNLFGYLGGGRRAAGLEDVRPGKPVTLEAPPRETGLWVRKPSGARLNLPVDHGGKAALAETDELGVYEVHLGPKIIQRLAVNLFDPAESDIRPEEKPVLSIGYVDVAGQTGWEPGRREYWKVLVLMGLVVLGLEWYIYKLRVQW